MEGIDDIILDSLRNLHCDIDENITALKQFDADLTVRAISRCLEAIIPDSKFPKMLHPSMSIRLEMSTNLAQQIKDLGFREDIGYQTILYCNEAEIRRVLMFLIERLPRESAKATDIEQTGYVPRLVKEIEKNVKASLEQFWLPANALNKGCRKYGDSFLVHNLGAGTFDAKMLRIPESKNNQNDALKKYWIHNVPEITKQCSQRQLLPSLLFGNSLPDLKDRSMSVVFNVTLKCVDIPSNMLSEQSELCNQIKVQGSTDLGIEERETSVQNEGNTIQALIEQLKGQQSKYLALQDDIKKCEMHLSETNDMKSEEDDVLNNTLSKINIKSKTLTVLSKQENLLRLKNQIQNIQNRLLREEDQWSEVRTSMLEEYKSAQNTKATADTKLQREQTKLKKLKESHSILTEDLRGKVLLEHQLKQKVDQIKKTSNRAGYTSRILEIIGNVKKQDTEIQKILRDTRAVQREINMLQGQIDRSFTMADELIFRDAKQEETARKSYKWLAALRDEFSNIIKVFTDLGAAERDSRNLQEQIDSEIMKETARKLERVNQDLVAVRKEIDALLKQQTA